MGKHRSASNAFSVTFIEVAAITAPILALVAIVLYIAKGSDDPVVAQGPEAVVASPPGAPGSGGSGTAPSPGEGQAFADETEPDADRLAGVDGSEPAAPESEVTRKPAAPPRSPIVWVRKGERVALLDRPGGEVVAEEDDETEFGSPSVFAVRRSTDRFVGVTVPQLPNGELGWIRAEPGKLRAGFVEHAVVVDLSSRSAELFYGGLRVRSWPVTVGAPGTETPTGTFGVTDTFRGGLNAAYGCCAVALSATQPDLPSGWLGGNRIAFHGTDGALGEAASSGCVRSSDEDVDKLVETVPLGTPVTIRE